MQKKLRILLIQFQINFQTGVATIESGIPDGWLGLDVGTESIKQFLEPIKRAKVIVWNG